MKTKVLLLVVFSSFYYRTFAQEPSVVISGEVLDHVTSEPLAFVGVRLFSASDSNFVSGSITNEKGEYSLVGVVSGEYLIDFNLIGYNNFSQIVFIGSNSPYILLEDVHMDPSKTSLGEVIVTGEEGVVSGQMNKKSYEVDRNVSQRGGSILHALENLPGVTVQGDKVEIRGNDQVTILMDGMQTAITGFGNQRGLDNIPASAILKIEVITNPSSKYDANGNAGIINVILKKNQDLGFSGVVGMSGGIGALWIRKENLPNTRPQSTNNPKYNPSLSLNYRNSKINLFLQADYLNTLSLNRNEFVTRKYFDGTIINQQLLRNRSTNFLHGKFGMDWYLDPMNSLTLSVIFDQENVTDEGDQPFFNGITNEQLRFWQFTEKEIVSTASGVLSYEHRFREPGHKLNSAIVVTMDQENESYSLKNLTTYFIANESFHLLANQRVLSWTLDYQRPISHGLLEMGLKYRYRSIPTNMTFNPSSANSVLDNGADGKADYLESIPSLYGNYKYELKKVKFELGCRLEYTNLQYVVFPGHNTYSSNGYEYFQFFPNLSATFRLNDRNNISAFFTRRVDRPDEVDIRIFPKYDDAEIIKVGNPNLKPQFTNRYELGHKFIHQNGYVYSAAYFLSAVGQIGRIASIVDSTHLIYSITQNAGASYRNGVEILIHQSMTDYFNVDFSVNVYRNQINSFDVDNLYPVKNTLHIDQQTSTSGNVKLSGNINLGSGIDGQVSCMYLAPDIIPQGKVESRFSINIGIKKSIQNGKGELFVNATDLLNTMIIKQEIDSKKFHYYSCNYYETQVINCGYRYRF